MNPEQQENDICANLLYQPNNIWFNDIKLNTAIMRSDTTARDSNRSTTASQLANQPASQLANQQASQLANQPANQLANQPANQPASRTTTATSRSRSNSDTIVTRTRPSVSLMPLVAAQPNTQPANQLNTQLAIQPNISPATQPNISPTTQPNTPVTRPIGPNKPPIKHNIFTDYDLQFDYYTDYIFDGEVAEAKDNYSNLNASTKDRVVISAALQNYKNAQRAAERNNKLPTVILDYDQNPVTHRFTDKIIVYSLSNELLRDYFEDYFVSNGVMQNIPTDCYKTNSLIEPTTISSITSNLRRDSKVPRYETVSKLRAINNLEHCATVLIVFLHNVTHTKQLSQPSHPSHPSHLQPSQPSHLQPSHPSHLQPDDCIELQPVQSHLLSDANVVTYDPITVDGCSIGFNKRVLMVICDSSRTWIVRNSTRTNMVLYRFPVFGTFNKLQRVKLNLSITNEINQHKVLLNEICILIDYIGFKRERFDAHILRLIEMMRCSYLFNTDQYAEYQHVENFISIGNYDSFVSALEIMIWFNVKKFMLVTYEKSGEIYTVSEQCIAPIDNAQVINVQQCSNSSNVLLSIKNYIYDYLQFGKVIKYTTMRQDGNPRQDGQLRQDSQLRQNSQLRQDSQLRQTNIYHSTITNRLNDKKNPPGIIDFSLINNLQIFVFALNGAHYINGRINELTDDDLLIYNYCISRYKTTMCIIDVLQKNIFAAVKTPEEIELLNYNIYEKINLPYRLFKLVENKVVETNIYPTPLIFDVQINSKTDKLLYRSGCAILICYK